ncbi:MAG: HEAT repeat domain-containing protein [Sumerlaeia bacterium]
MTSQQPFKANQTSEPRDTEKYQALIVDARNAPNPEERINAIEMLAELKGDAREALETLEDIAAKDPDGHVKAKAIEAAQTIRGAS